MSIADLAVVVIMVFVFSIVLLFSGVMLDEFSQVRKVQDNSEANQTISDAKTMLFNLNDWFPLIFIGLIGSVGIGAFFIKTHPVFFVASLVLLILFLLISPVFVNTFNEFAGQEQFSGVVDEYEEVVTFWQNLPVIVLVASVILLVLLYGKFGRGSGAPTY